MSFSKKVNIPILETLLMIILGILSIPAMLYFLIAHFIDYNILKNYHFKSKKWDLNICSGQTDGGGINADVVKRNVSNFKLIKNIYKLPFKDKQFNNVLCSHTMEHVEKPEKFYKELKRISKNLVLLIPPVWDIASFFHIREHKWQFLTAKTRHENNLPTKIKLPYDFYHNMFGQNIA